MSGSLVYNIGIGFLGNVIKDLGYKYVVNFEIFFLSIYSYYVVFNVRGFILFWMLVNFCLVGESCLVEFVEGVECL